MNVLSKITICKKEGRKTHYDWLNRVSIIVGKLGSALSELSELSECPNRAECPKRGRVVRICPIVRACPTDFWGFVRPKAEPRPFCPSRARLSELSNVRMPTPGMLARAPEQITMSVSTYIARKKLLRIFPNRESLCLVEI